MFIYCIEDINDLKYVGKTKQKLNDRYKAHKSDKYLNKGCSSSKLHLEHSIIYLLEECEEDLAKEREQYWIETIDCVNEYNAVRKLTKEEYNKQYQIEYRKKNKEKHNAYKREWRKLKKQQSKIKSTE